MKIRAKKLLSLIMSFVMAVTIMSMCMVSMTAGAAAPDEKRATYNGFKEYYVELDGEKYLGYILVPEEEGKYPVNVLYCGTGGLQRWKRQWLCRAFYTRYAFCCKKQPENGGGSCRLGV